MADITKFLSKRAEDVTVTKEDGAAAFTIDYDGRSDENTVVLIENTDSSNACRVKFSAGTGMSAGLGDLDVDIATSSLAVVGVLPSARFQNDDGKIDVAVTDQDDTAFTGSEADVKFIVIELPKALTD